MGILSGKAKDEPLHYGEIFSLWTTSMVTKGNLSSYQVYLNHAGDKDLKKILDDLIDQAKLVIKECDTLLTDNGISATPIPPDRPSVRLDDIPEGARFSDFEISSKIASDISLGLVAYSGVIGQSIREDVGALFVKYHITTTALGAKIIHLIKGKGWLIPPPLQVKRNEHAHA